MCVCMCVWVCARVTKNIPHRLETLCIPVSIIYWADDVNTDWYSSCHKNMTESLQSPHSKFTTSFSLIIFQQSITTSQCSNKPLRWMWSCTGEHRAVWFIFYTPNFSFPFLYSPSDTKKKKNPNTVKTVHIQNPEVVFKFVSLNQQRRTQRYSLYYHASPYIHVLEAGIKKLQTGMKAEKITSTSNTSVSVKLHVVHLQICKNTNIRSKSKLLCIYSW